MIVGLRLFDIEFTDFISVLANNFFAFFAKDLPPGINAVHSDTFRHVVSVKAHFGNKLPIVFILNFFITTSCQVE